MGFGLGSLASAVGGFLTSGAGTALTSAVANNYFNKKAAKKQFGYTKSLIDYENEYNLPANQRARLEEAGYNPNLALNGVNVTSATGSAPNVQPAKLDLLGAYNLEAQNDLLKAQQDATYWQAGVNQYRATKENADSRIAQYNADYAEAEHDLWKKTGKIPERYLRSDWSGELTGVIKGLLSRFIGD